MSQPFLANIHHIAASELVDRDALAQINARLELAMAAEAQATQPLPRCECGAPSARPVIDHPAGCRRRMEFEAGADDRWR